MKNLIDAKFLTLTCNCAFACLVSVFIGCTAAADDQSAAITKPRDLGTTKVDGSGSSCGKVDLKETDPFECAATKKFLDKFDWNECTGKFEFCMENSYEASKNLEKVIGIPAEKICYPYSTGQVGCKNPQEQLCVYNHVLVLEGGPHEGCTELCNVASIPEVRIIAPFIGE